MELYESPNTVHSDANRQLELANRIVIAAIAQYSAEGGQMNDWHLMHLGQLASSCAALLTIEATAVTPDRRNTYGDVGLYSDHCEVSMARVLLGVRQWPDLPIGIQLNHAGRKASRQKPWERGAQIPPGPACLYRRGDGTRQVGEFPLSEFGGTFTDFTVGAGNSSRKALRAG